MRMGLVCERYRGRREQGKPGAEQQTNILPRDEETMQSKILICKDKEVVSDFYSAYQFY